MGLIVVNAQDAERARVRAEKKRAVRQRYENKHPERQKHHGSNTCHNPHRPKYQVYDFVMWDGEAPQDTGYSLFGSSLGHEICKPHLGTEECFDLLLAAKAENPHTIFVIFGGRYDFDEICRQSMPLDRLVRLKEYGHCTWHGYTIKQMEGKMFVLKKGGITVTVYEIFSWFHKSYVKALQDYHIGTESELDLLVSEKNRRAEFLWTEIDDIKRYFRLELKLGPPLMEKIREICLQAGFNPRHWYGPSALALESLRKNHIDHHKGTIPLYVSVASQYAYAGGRFETFRGGILSPVYSADKNSAYMAAALELPDLADGTWRRGKHFEPGKFAVYHIRYNTPVNARDPIRLYPLFCRHSNGTVTWPHKVEGWYWAPEAELVKDDPHAVFLEAYIYDEQSEVRPFHFVREWYRKRLVLESLPISNPSRKAGKAFKWALAAIYGQLARTVGYDRFHKTAPKYHCLEWAGYITSHCRAEMYKVAKACGDKLIAIDTDSVTALCPLEIQEGRELGEWKTVQYDQGVFFQSGVSAMERDGKWTELHSRGIEERRGRLPVSPEMMISAIYDNRPIQLNPRKRYVSIRMALNHRLSEIGTWKDHPSGKLVFGGNGKRYHRANTCYRSGNPLCDSAESHVFVPRPAFTIDRIRPGEIPLSHKHLLPWRDGKTTYQDSKLIADLLWIDPDAADTEDREWLTTLL